MQPLAEAPFSRQLPLRAASVERGRFDATASEAEAAAVAALFDVTHVGSVAITGDLTLTDGHFRLIGRAMATVEQACVVTAEPVVTTLEALFDRFVVVGPEPEPMATVEIDPDERDVDYVAEPVVDIGAIAVEELALVLPVYPRSAAADAALAAVDVAAPAPDSPFAALARRRSAS